MNCANQDERWSMHAAVWRNIQRYENVNPVMMEMLTLCSSHNNNYLDPTVSQGVQRHLVSRIARESVDVVYCMISGYLSELF